MIQVIMFIFKETSALLSCRIHLSSLTVTGNWILSDDCISLFTVRGEIILCHVIEPTIKVIVFEFTDFYPTLRKLCVVNNDI